MFMGNKPFIFTKGHASFKKKKKKKKIMETLLTSYSFFVFCFLSFTPQSHFTLPSDYTNVFGSLEFPGILV